ncbi:3-oxoacyl-ACP reductase [Streptomyces sp. TS71-3]|nr:3-oxoacyl-ACP reductase [Streptomyces sp. TS71-3]
MEYARYPSLAGKVVWVSGGATGLGAEFVRQFCAQGARVAFADIDEPAGRLLCDAAAEETGSRPLFLPADVRDVPAYTEALATAARTLGPVSVLVNNAADDDRRDSATIDQAYWDDKLAVNLRHHFFAIQAVTPGMRELGGGSIVNMGSVSAHIPLTRMPAYIASKAAVEGLTRTLARELGPDRIRVNCVIPGWIMTERQLRDWVTPEAEQLIDASQSLPGRLVPADVARMVLWLAADDSGLCTGQKWVVDGGWT